MINRLIGNAHDHAIEICLAAAQVSAPAWMCPTRNLQPQAVARLEAVGCRPQVDSDPQASVAHQFAPSWFDPEKAIANINRAPIGMHVAQPAEEIAVLQARAHVKLQRYRADQFEGILQRPGSIAEHIRSFLQYSIILRTHMIGTQKRPANRGRGIGRIVKITPAGRFNIRGTVQQLPARMKIITHWLRRGRPFVELAPFVSPHNVQRDGFGAQFAVIALQMCIEPIQAVTQAFQEGGRGRVIPGPDRQVRLLST